MGRVRWLGRAQDAARRDCAERPVNGDEAEEVDVGEGVGDHDVRHSLGGGELADAVDEFLSGHLHLREERVWRSGHAGGAE